MRITNNFIYRNTPSFTSYNKLNPKTNLSVSTSFYHDYPALQKAVDIIEKEFPHGTDILIYAGSNGEEAISVDSMLKHPEKYHISSIDPFKEAIDYANRAYYGVHALDDDGFLINTMGNPLTPEQYELRSKFYKNVDEIPRPKKDLNNLQDEIFKINMPGIEMEKYYKLKPDVKQRIKFVRGDIRNIKSFPVQTENGKVGAVFFRNALYHLTQNDLTGILKCGDKPNMNINKTEILKNLARDIDNKLDIGGIFVMGNHTQEHFYIADGYTPPENSVLFDAKRNIRLMTFPPHVKAFLDLGNFEPVFEEAIRDFTGQTSLTLPIIWKKIK